MVQVCRPAVHNNTLKIAIFLQFFIFLSSPNGTMNRRQFHPNVQNTRSSLHDFGEKSVRHDFGAKIARTQPRDCKVRKFPIALTTKEI